MCNFFSAIVLRNGDVLSHPMIDSHSELVEYFKLPDATVHHQHFAKVELTPQSEDAWLDPSKWKFTLDEKTVPGWWDDVASTAEATMRARAERMILRDGRSPRCGAGRSPRLSSVHLCERSAIKLSRNLSNWGF